MWLLAEPSQQRIRTFLDSQRGRPFSYPEPGAAIRQWKMFDTGWTRVCWPDAPIQTGTAVAVLVRHFGFWSLNAARIVYLIEEGRRFGCAYGTLPEHGETGEERFSVEHLPDNSVWYEIYAFSRPRGLARIAFPLARRLQKRFARDSKQAMLRAANY